MEQIDKGRSFSDESTIQHTAQLDRHEPCRQALRGMLASAVIKVAIGHFNSTISGEVKLHRNMRNDLENMKMTLESVEAVLREAERESIKHKSMLLWLKQLIRMP